MDRLGEVVRAVVASTGQKPGDIRPQPRPVTAVDRARRDLRYRKHLNLVQEVKESHARYEAMRG